MSDTASTTTKTLTEVTESSESEEEPLVQDRWSHNITYRQLVLTSCVGIVQLWWHPYISDLSKLIPFVFLYNMFSCLVAYPMFYLELALGIVTRKSVLKCWDLSPSARGIGISMLLCCVFTAFATSVVCAYCLSLFVHSFHSFLPWLHCAAAAHPPCSARHRPITVGSETPAQSFFLNYVLKLKRNGFEGGFGPIVKELAIYFVISWFLIYLIAIKRIYSYSKMILFKDILAFFMIICCSFGVARLKGAGIMFEKADWSSLGDSKMWRVALEYALIEMTISQGSLIMLGAYCPKEKQRLSLTALFAFVVAKGSGLCTTLILGATHGALRHDYNNNTNLINGSASSMILWSDYVSRVPGSQFWSAIIFFTMFVVAVTSTSLPVQTIMSSFTGKSVRKMGCAILLLMCILFCLIGIILLCSQSGVYILDFLMSWPVTRVRVPIAALTGIVVTYIYGQSRFCEDVFFSAGEYPGIVMRACWAVVPPVLILLFTFFTAMDGGAATEKGARGEGGRALGWSLVTLTMTPFVLIMMFYVIFKCRVRNIVS